MLYFGLVVSSSCKGDEIGVSVCGLFGVDSVTNCT